MQRCATSRVLARASGTVAELGGHLLRGFEIELVRGKTEPLGIRQGPAGLEAEQDLMGMGLLLVQVVAVIGGHHLDPQFPAKFPQSNVGAVLFLYAVFLQFEIEPVAEQVPAVPGPACVRPPGRCG